jgi:hypothetical protein
MAPDSKPVPWSTYAACALVALGLGTAGVFAGRAASPEPAKQARVGAFTLERGSATVRVIEPVGLPGDPLPTEDLPEPGAEPRRADSGRTPLVSYEAAGEVVVARPTTKGTLVVRCAGRTPVERCAASAVNAGTSGRPVSTAPSAAVRDSLREAMKSVEQATGIASAELQGDRSQRAGAVKRLALELNDAASTLEIDGADVYTAAGLEEIRSAMAGESAALDDLGNAIDRRSGAAFDAARDSLRASHAKLTEALGAFKRAGYPVAP